MKIRTKILLSFLFSIAITIGMSWQVYQASNEVRVLNQEADDIQIQLLAATGLRASVRNYVLDVYDAIFVSGVEVGTYSTISSRQRVEDSLKKFEKAMQSNGGDSWLGDVKKVQTAYFEVSAGLEATVVLAQNSNLPAAKKALREVRDDKFKKDFIETISKFIEARAKETEATSIRQYASLDQLKQTVVMLTTLGILLSGLVILLVSSSIGHRLASLERAAKDVSNGNFEINLPTKGRDEIATLSSVFNHMASSLRAAKNELATQQQLIVSTSKMSALGEMAGGIAHEINTPLAIIQLRTEQIQEAFEDGVKCDKEFLTETCLTILKTVDRIAKIIRGLRSFARDGRNDSFAAASAQMIVNDTLDFCMTKIKGHGTDLKLNLPTDPLLLECQSTEISQVLLNLINNAFDAVQNLPEKWIALEVADKGEHVEISVMDSGGGIPADVCKKIMQPFFTTKALGKGTGLGLSISKGIVDAHHGRLNLDKLSKNTRFVIVLPKKQPSTVNVAA